MLFYKFLLVLNEGLIFGLLAIGIYVAFQWLRFPDLTPDGSFVLGGSAYVKASILGFPPIFSLLLAVVAGSLGGGCTAIVAKVIKIPSVVAGLVVSSAFYSLNWLILGKPNQFLDPDLTLVGNVLGRSGSFHLLIWLFFICIFVGIILVVFSKSTWGIRMRAIGENPLLARDLLTSETKYTLLGLAIANGLVGLSGALFVQRSFSADINMGIGVTISGLSGIILGLLFLGEKRKMSLIFLCILLGSTLNKVAVFLTLEIGIPAESFRLISAFVLLTTFLIVKTSNIDFFRGLRWN